MWVALLQRELGDRWIKEARRREEKEEEEKVQKELKEVKVTKFMFDL